LILCASESLRPVFGTWDLGFAQLVNRYTSQMANAQASAVTTETITNAQTKWRREDKPGELI